MLFIHVFFNTCQFELIQKKLGEYDVQTGFGWTNGVIIDFMVIFGDDLLSDEEDVELMEGKSIFFSEFTNFIDHRLVPYAHLFVKK